MKKLNAKTKEKALTTLVKAFDLASERIFDKELTIGKYVVKKKNDLYFVYLGQDVVFGDLYLIEVAILLAQHLDKGKFTKLKILEKLDIEYSKWHNDMGNYKRRHKTSDEDTKIILEARYYDAKSNMNRVKYEIRQITA